MKQKQNEDEDEDEDEEVNNDNSSSDEANNLIELRNDFMDDTRVLNALSAIPDKYVIFSEEDQEKVIALYGVIGDVAKERDHKYANNIAVKATLKLLQNSKYYSQISMRTINRWYELKDNENQRTGRKVDEIFESEVWGKLMLCVFNKKVTMIICKCVFGTMI